MSLALDVYISYRVVLEQRSNEDTFHVDGTTSSPPSYIAPFETVELGNIFRHACSMSAVERQELEKFDLPIRWLTAPVQYDEARHIGAMTALEAILSTATLGGGIMLGRSPFDALRKKLAAVICEHVTDVDLAKLMCRNFRISIEQVFLTNSPPICNTTRSRSVISIQMYWLVSSKHEMRSSTWGSEERSTRTLGRTCLLREHWSPMILRVSSKLQR
jgi:hypothetical protein